MTRIRGGLAALALGVLLAGCGPVESAPAAGGASSAGPAAATSPADGAASSQADGGGAASQDTSGGGGRWCEAVKAFTASMDPLLATGAVDKAGVERARATLKELRAAAPPEISTQVRTYSEFAAAVIDTRGKSMAEDPAAYARLGSKAQKLQTAMPPVSDYTVKHCPALDKPLPVQAS
ncbi:hypothetical protein [Micromonospora chersina]|uniref:hypothetical protein n=1 Tax=Micromonospora chersina TaxID=47854 RepID=UPI00371E2521